MYALIAEARVVLLIHYLKRMDLELNRAAVDK